MKIGLLVDIGARNEKERESAAREIKDVLEKAGYAVSLTWPDLGGLTKRIEKIRNDIKSL